MQYTQFQASTLVASRVISCIHKSDVQKSLRLYQLTPCSRVFLWKLLRGHIVQKETALMVAARAARSAPSSQRSRKEQLDGKKSAVFCRWYFALRNKRHYMSWSRTLLCNAPRGDLPCGWSGVGSSNADTTYPWSSVATSRCVLMACPFTTRRDNFTSTVCLEKPLDILMCPQSGGCMLNRVITYTSTYIPCRKSDQICLPLFNSAAKNKS